MPISPPTDSLYKFMAIAGVLLYIASQVLIEEAEERYNVAYAEVADEYRQLGAERESILGLAEQQLEHERSNALRMEAIADTAELTKELMEEALRELVRANAQAERITAAAESLSAIAEQGGQPDALADRILGAMQSETTTRYARAEMLIERAENLRSTSRYTEALMDTVRVAEVRDSLEGIRGAYERRADSLDLLLEPHEVRIEFLQQRRRDAQIRFWFGTIAGVALMLAGFWLWYDRVQRYQDVVARHAAVVAQREL